MNGLISADTVREHARNGLAYGNHPHVRLAAVDALLRIDGERAVAAVVPLLETYADGATEARFRYQLIQRA